MLSRVLRWLMVPVSAVAVVAAVIVAARRAVVMIDAGCAPQSMVGGSCVEPWHTTAVELAIHAAIVAAAAGLVLLPALIAPQLKRTTACAGFLLAVGALTAAYLRTLWPELLPPLLTAAVSGGVSLWWIWYGRLGHARR